MICKIESKNISDDVVSLYYRIKKSSATKKSINRFRNYLCMEMKMINELPTAIISKNSDTPDYGRVGMDKKGCIVNIISSENYVHVIAVMKKDMRNKFVEGMKHFKKTNHAT